MLETIVVEETKKEKVKTHSSIAILLTTKAKLEEYRKYPRETYDEIIMRMVASVESRRGKKEETK